MFTGIIETLGKVLSIRKESENVHFEIESSIFEELQIDQSISHNGTCLTIVALYKDKNSYVVTAIKETLEKTNLGFLKVGDETNLERAMIMNTRLDGHIVQGHVDQVGLCVKKQENDGSWSFVFSYKVSRENIIVEKGSICINGISLTAFNVTNETFEVAIIPYTIEHTNLKNVDVNTPVNLEFDIIGKYVARINAL
jgi:riboflavin synthase